MQTEKEASLRKRISFKTFNRMMTFITEGLCKARSRRKNTFYNYDRFRLKHVASFHSKYSFKIITKIENANLKLESFDRVLVELGKMFVFFKNGYS